MTISSRHGVPSITGTGTAVNPHCNGQQFVTRKNHNHVINKAFMQPYFYYPQENMMRWISLKIMNINYIKSYLYRASLLLDNFSVIK